MQIYILTANGATLCSLSNKSDWHDTFNFYDSKFTQNVLTPETFEFTCLMNHPNSKHIAVGNQVIFKYKDDYHLFKITEIEESHSSDHTASCYCEGVSLELLNSVVSPATLNGASITTATDAILANTGWELGEVDSTDIKDMEFSNFNTALAEIQTLAELFELNVRYRIEYDTAKGVTGKYIDFVETLGEKRGIRFEYGVNTADVSKKVSSENVCTAVIPIGADDLTITDIACTTAVHGFDKARGVSYVALDEVERSKITDSPYHIFTTIDVDSADAYTLATKAWEHLQDNKVPKIEYTFNPTLLSESVSIGDIVYCIDREMDLQLEATVAERSICFESSDKDEITLSNFVEAVSNIDVDLIKEIQNQLNNAELEKNVIISTERPTPEVDKPLTWVDTSQETEEGKIHIETWDGQQWLESLKQSDVEASIEVNNTEIRQEFDVKIENYVTANAEPILHKGGTPPTNPVDGQLWLDTSSTPNVWKRYKASTSTWVEVITAGADLDARQAIEDAETAIADLQAEASETATQLSNTVADLNTTKTNLQSVEADLEARATELVGDINTLEGRVSTNEVDIQTNATAISTKVSQTEFDNLSIGGRNLVRNSSLDTEAVPDFWGNHNQTISFSNGYCAVTKEETTSRSRLNQQLAKNPLLNLTEGKYYTISADFKALDGYSIPSDSTLHVRWEYAESGYDEIVINIPTTLPTDSWTRLNQAGLYILDEGKTFNNCNVSFAMGRNAGGLCIKNIKLEQGNKATDYTRAPEDIDADITAVDNRLTTSISEMTITAEEIATRVSQTTVDNLQIGGANLLPKASVTGYSGATLTENDYVFTLTTTDGAFFQGIQIPSSLIEIGEKYVLSFKIQKVSGTVASLGGHVGMCRNFKIYRDGTLISNYWDSSDGIPYPDDTTVYEYAIHFEGYSATIENKDLYIQPNRPTYSQAYSMKIWDLQLEKGDKQTSWQPCSEDASAEITALGTRISSAESKITQHADLIATKVTSSEVENIVNTAIESLSGDGRNMILYGDCSDFPRLEEENYYACSDDSGHSLVNGNLRLTSTAVNTNKTYYLGNGSSLNGFQLDTYTFSFDAKIPSDSSLTTSYVKVGIDEYNGTAWNTVAGTLASLTPISTSGDWNRYSLTMTFNQEDATKRVPFFQITYVSTIDSAYILLDNIKIERGAEATAFSKNPNELTNAEISALKQRVTTAESTIEQHADLIESKVSQSTYEQGINGLDERIDSANSTIEQHANLISQKVDQTTFEALEIGGRNLALNTGTPITYEVAATNYNYHTFTPSVTPLEQGATYTASGNVEFLAGSSETIRVSVYNSNISTSQGGYNCPITDGRFVGTFTVTGSEGTKILVYNGQSGATLGNQIILSNFKFEKGNKATDYTEAPEDVDADINAVNVRVTDANSVIEQHANLISQRVTQTTFDAYKNETDADISGLTGRVSTAESTIEQHADMISQRVTKTEFDSLTIGGRNLVIHSTGDHEYPLLVGDTTTRIGNMTVSFEDDGSLKFVANSTTTNDRFYQLGSKSADDVQGLKNDTAYTFSFDMYVPSTNTVGFPQVLYYWHNGTKYTPKTLATPSSDRVFDDWKRYSFTETFPNEAIGKFFRIFVGDLQDGEYVKVRNIKIEEGSKPTAYTVAPEDVTAYVDNSISTSESNMTQTAEEIALSVTNTAISNLEIGGTNLLENSSFAKDASEWAYSNWTPTFTTMDGKTCGKITHTSTGHTSYVYQDILEDLEPNTTYTLSAWIFTENIVRGTTNFHLRLYMEGYYDNNGTSTYFSYGSVQPTLNTGKWEFVSKTFATDAKLDSATSYRAYIHTRDFTGTVYFRNLKLEKGNKATDWTPSNDDVLGDLEVLDQRVTTNSATLDLHADSIASKVSQSTYNTDKANMTSEISRVESSITQTATSIATTVINNAVNNLQIGGRNLLSGTSDEYVTVTMGEWNYPLSTKLALADLGLVAGDTITLSFYAKVPSDSPSSVYLGISAFKSNNTYSTNAGGTQISAGKEGFTSYTYTIPSDITHIQPCVQRSGADTGATSFTFQYKCVMLEKSTKPSNWSPSPEDVEANVTNSISASESKMEQTANSIALSVTSTAIDNIKVGGANLLSYKQLVFDGVTPTYASDYEFSITSSAQYTGIKISAGSLGLKANTEYRLSFYAKFTGGTFEVLGGNIDTATFSQAMIKKIDNTSYNLSWSSITSHPTSIATLMSDGAWHKYEIQVITTDSITSSNVIWIQPNRGKTTSITMSFKDIQFEEGILATTFSPSQSDLVENINIGSTNLYPMKNVSFIDTATKNGAYEFSMTTAQAYGGFRILLTQLADYKTNTEYRFSFYAKQTAGTLYDIGGHTGTNEAYKYIKLIKVDDIVLDRTWSSTENFPTDVLALASDGEWHRYVVALKTNSNYSSSYYLQVHPNRNDATSVTMSYKNIQLEEGNKETDWKPCYIDTDSNITALTTRVSTAEQKITDEAIVSTVTSSTTYKDMLGVNKWMAYRYTDDATRKEPTMATIEGKTPVESFMVDDIATLAFSVDKGNNFIARFFTNVYLSADKTISFSFTHDDGGAFYVDGVKQYGSSENITSATAKSITLKAGWHSIDALFHEISGGERIGLGLKLSDQVDQMTCVGGTGSSDGSRIVNAESRITQHDDEIDARVTKDGVINAINISTEGVKISTDKLVISDINNYAQLNEKTYSQWGWTRWTDSESTYNPWYRKEPTGRYHYISSWHTCNGGETFRIKGQIATAVCGASTEGGTDVVGLKVQIAIVHKRADSTNNYWNHDGGVTSTGVGVAVQGTINRTVTLPDTARSFAVVIQINGWAPMQGAVRVRNVSVTKMSNAELIVDGTITANKIQANTITGAQIASDTITAEEIASNAVTADKINAKGLTVTNTNNEETFKIDSNGNVTVKGTLNGTDGRFEGELVQTHSLANITIADGSVSVDSNTQDGHSTSIYNSGVMIEDGTNMAHMVSNEIEMYVGKNEDTSYDAYGYMMMKNDGVLELYGDNGVNVASKLTVSGSVTTSTSVTCDSISTHGIYLSGDNSIYFSRTDSGYDNLTVSNGKVMLKGRVIADFNRGSSALWSGGLGMIASQSITPSKSIEACANGWILVWSRYDGTTSYWDNINVNFIPKFSVITAYGNSILFSFSMQCNSTQVNKRLYTNGNVLTGVDANTASQTNTYNYFNNSALVLRHVLEF